MKSDQFVHFKKTDGWIAGHTYKGELSTPSEFESKIVQEVTPICLRWIAGHT